MSDIKEIALTVAALVVALSTIGGALGWLLLPRVKEWLKREIAEPVQETRHKVSDNGGKNNPPTLPDQNAVMNKKLDRLVAGLNALTRNYFEIKEEIVDLRDRDRAQLAAFEEHLRWSKEWTAINARDPD